MRVSGGGNDIPAVVVNFYPLHCRWIDEWAPTADPDKVLAQALHCYTPVDFRLLLEGTGLAIKRIEVGGEEVDVETSAIIKSGLLLQAWSYFV